MNKTAHINQLLPASLESERGLLCSFCLDPRTVGAILAEMRIGPDHFTNPRHAALCERMQARWQEGRPITMRLLMKDMEDGHEGEIYASEILTHISTAAYAEEYAEKVCEKFRMRAIIIGTEDIHEAAWMPLAESAPLLESIGKLSAIAAPAPAPKSFKQLLTEKWERMEHGEPNHDFISTGIKGLDQQSPLRLGDMPLIAGERKAGKSILALSIAANIAASGRTVAIFSLEDSSAKVIDRLFAGASRVPTIAHHMKGMPEGEMQRVERAFKDLVTQKIHIRDDVHDVQHICAVVRQLKARDPGLVLAVVDYAQLVRAKVAKGANREQEVATVSRALRLLGLELGVAMMVLCQLNKEGDTRESKALEQDTTAMWKILKLPEEIEKDKFTREESDANANKRKIFIPFQRNGESNIAFLVTFFGHIARVDNLADE